MKKEKEIILYVEDPEITKQKDFDSQDQGVKKRLCGIASLKKHSAGSGDTYEKMISLVSE
jgi:hypothetical protein